MATQTPVLNLDTLVARQTARIDGQVYELRAVGELSMFDLRLLNRIAKQLRDVEDATTDAQTSAQEAEYARLLAKGVRLILIAPDAIHAKLLPAHQEAILWAFIRLSRPSLTPTRATTSETPKRVSRRTTARSSHGSRGSTAAHRKAG